MDDEKEKVGCKSKFHEKEKVKNVLTEILIVCIMNIPLVCRRKLWREINIQRRRESG